MAGSSSSPERLEVAELLARRATEDLKVARKLAPDLEIDEGAVGFHAQQSVEKALKVALTMHGVDFPKTHDHLAVELAESAVSWCKGMIS